LQHIEKRDVTVLESRFEDSVKVSNGLMIVQRQYQSHLAIHTLQPIPGQYLVESIEKFRHNPEPTSYRGFAWIPVRFTSPSAESTYG
jgi:hypothetical protein